jgi:hypothetical protein
VAQNSSASEERAEEGRTKLKVSVCSKLARGLILTFAVVCLSGNVLAQQKPFLVLDIYAKAVTAAERDPLAPIEQDLMKGKDPEIPKNFSHLITETFSLKPNPQPFGVLDGAIEDQLINLSFIAAASGDGHWILSAYGGNIRDKNSDHVETGGYSVKDSTVRRADQKVFHTLKSPIKSNERKAQVVYLLVFSLQRGEDL